MTKYNQTTKSLKPQQGVNTAYFDKDMTARLGLDGSKSNYSYYNLTLPVILLTSMMVSCSPAYAVTNSAFEMRLQGYSQSDTPYNSERLKKGGYQTEATFTQSQDNFIKSNLNHCSKNNQTEQQLFSISINIKELQETEQQTEDLKATCSDSKSEQKQSLSSPYLGTFSVPQNVKADFLHTLGNSNLEFWDKLELNSVACMIKVAVEDGKNHNSKTQHLVEKKYNSVKDLHETQQQMQHLNATKQVEQQTKDKTSNIKVLQKVEQQLERLIPLQNNLSKLDIKKPSNDRQMKNPLTSNRGQGYDVDLSQKQIAVKPSRYLLAIFVPANWSSSQLHQSISTNHFTHSQGKTVISMVSKSPTTYDGAIFGECKSLLGKYPKAATICAESEPRHPMTFHSVALTQKQIGGQNHA